MTRPNTPPILSELYSAHSPAGQVKALRNLKNDVIGHEQMKQLCVEHGVLPSLVHILNSYKGEGMTRAAKSNAAEEGARRKINRSEEENARLQAIIVVGSLAHGGPAFIPSLHASHAIPSLLSLLSSADISSQTIVQILRTLNSIADALSLSTPERNTDTLFARSFYTQENIRNISHLLEEVNSSVSPGTIPHNERIALIATLISKTCQAEYQRKLAAESGVLDAFARQLVAWIPPSFPVWDDGKRLRWEWRISSEASMSSSHGGLSSLLHATGVIIHHSKYRAEKLLRMFDGIFRNADNQLRRAWENLTANVPTSMKGRIPPAPTSAECLAPAMPGSQPRRLATSRDLPPLDPIKAMDVKGSRSLSSAIEIFTSSGLERIADEESTFIAWLIHIARGTDVVTGLMAAWMLAVLYRLGLVKDAREVSIALLIIPPLVRLLEKAEAGSLPSDTGIDASLDEFMREESPAVLAMLTINNSRTQKAAVDAGAILVLSQLLKRSYDPLHTFPSSPMWSSEPSTSNVNQDADGASKVGPVGVSPQVRHTMKVRETALIAMAALASDKDEYRRATIDAGVISFIVRTLKAEDVRFGASNSSIVPEDQDIEQRIRLSNCKDTVLAACGAARALSRSVSTLRTNLMDAGLAAPLFVLLKCRDIELKIAATAVICNLVLEFSPMREAVLDNGILGILCEHAHMNDPSLRLNSLWALKHLVVNASSKLKKECAEGLGIGWLRQIINSDPEVPSTPSFFRTGDRDDGNLTPIRMSTPNAAGEQVDLLNAVEDSRESSQAPEDDVEEDTRMSDSIGSLSKNDLNLRPRATVTRNGPPLSLSQPLELLPDVPDEAGIVKQALEFVRNLMLGNDIEGMIDFVFQQIGQDEFFRIIASKIKPRALNAFGGDRRSLDSSRIRSTSPHSDILTSAVYCLVHIAAGGPRHKNLFIHQTKLLESLPPLLSHPDPEIRVSCSWVPYNLSWDNDSADSVGCRDRARRLKEMGFVEKLQEMGKDSDLNCRERAKSTLDVMAPHLIR
ncbi:uncharacterized protein KY384_000314 [Bacidia gigantensis]|uniref:uncharacterized protein n=1 Tax=Bacidia gigantensis TaxID=2732470 RepID=UPI001D03C0A8|nr:uncharacterized protein KY384_000314 [Bacidia gigantensis]KAG8526321.1 hypothetical protein KY384_000314 [Bacidia gigantensis]